MQRAHRFTGFALAGLIAIGSVVSPMAAQASEEGKRNTTYGLGAAAAALLLTQKNKLPGLLAAGGAVYSYSQLNNDINKRHKRERAAAYRNGYSRGSSYARYHRSTRRSVRR
jgi:hypothetical protein